MLFFRQVTKENKAILKPVAVVSCWVCKCLINLNGAIKIDNVFGGTYYCATHRPNYDRVSYLHGTRNMYFKEFEVDKNGKIIKSKK